MSDNTSISLVVVAFCLLVGLSVHECGETTRHRAEVQSAAELDHMRGCVHQCAGQ